MCCFSGNVTFVGDTRIFARMLSPGRQGLVYQMRLGAEEDLAMILPLPVVPGSAEAAVEFSDLSGYPRFFQDLDSGFPRPPQPPGLRGGVPPPAAEGLAVQQVGSYEASFVPALADFTRLDERFRLPGDVWKDLPQFADYGFAVFKLRKGEREIHPMAFAFPTRHANRLFFPTVHIHDGKVHPEEAFDHSLYCQVQRSGFFAMTRWDESPGHAGSFCKTDLTRALVVPDQHMRRRKLIGKHPNQDILLAAA